MHDPPPIPDNRQPPTTQPVIVQLSNVAPRPIHWLWPQRIPLGKLTLLVGDPAVGKSLLAADIAARVSAGIPWPDAPNETNQPAGVVLLCTEDDLADTVRPRLDAANADHRRIAAITSVKRNILSPLPVPLRTICLLPGLPHLETAIHNTPECRLVIIDPILPSLNLGATPSNADTRAVIEPLAERDLTVDCPPPLALQEARNQKSNYSKPFEHRGFRHFGIRSFRFVSDFEVRISDSLIPYSCRNASIGSIAAARMAG